MPSTLRRRELAWEVALLLAWAAVGFVLLLCRQSQLFWNYDGSYIFNLLQRQHTWAVPFHALSIDFYQGLGDTFMPANMRLLAETYLVDLIADRGIAKAGIYAIQLLELTAVVTVFGRLIGIGPVASLAGALLVGAAMFPFYRSGATHPIVALSPVFTPQLIAGYGLACCILLLGRYSTRIDIGLACAMTVIGFWVLLAGPLTIVLSVLFFGVVMTSGVIAARGRERWRKIVVTLSVLVILAASGGASFLAGLIFNSAPAVFTAELVNDRQTFFFTSILFHWSQYGPVGPVLAVSGILGALLTIRSEHRVLRIFAITLLTYLISRLLFGVLVILIDFWRGPSPLYFEFFAIPLYCLFSAIFWARLLKWLVPRRRLDAIGVARAKGIVVVMVCLAAASAVRSPEPLAPGFVDDPKPTDVARFLETNLGMAPGQPFRGRVATMTGRALPSAVGWLDLHQDDLRVSAATGGEIRLYGLHIHGVPTLAQYTPTITPALYAFTSRLLSDAEDTQMRSVLVMRRIDPRILALIGVRYVVTDKRYDGDAALRLTMPVGTDRQLLVYEIADTNTGNYSPTKAVVVADATETLQRIARPGFNGRHDVVAYAALPDGLEPARAARLVFEGASLRVVADSAGRSLLVLPLEFSRCLDVETLSGEPPTIQRVNLVETGFLFRGAVEARLRLRYGPFINSSCRLRDRFDLEALKIGDIPRILPHR